MVAARGADLLHDRGRITGKVRSPVSKASGMPPSSGGSRAPDTGITPGDEHEIETMERCTSGSDPDLTAPRGANRHAILMNDNLC
jgi:hypothetical protein